MIRGTKNEGISCIAKQVTQDGAGPPNPGHMLSESIEHVVLDTVTGATGEASESGFRLAAQTACPSGEFTGTYE